MPDILKYQIRLDHNEASDRKSIVLLKNNNKNRVLRDRYQTIRMVVVIESEVMSVIKGKGFVFSLEESEGEKG